MIIFLNDYAFTFKFECFIGSRSEKRVMHLFRLRQGNYTASDRFKLCKYSANESRFENRENG